MFIPVTVNEQASLTSPLHNRRHLQSYCSEVMSRVKKQLSHTLVQFPTTFQYRRHAYGREVGHSGRRDAVNKVINGYAPGEVVRSGESRPRVTKGLVVRAQSPSSFAYIEVALNR